jgi:hypothetical protein
VTVDDHPTLAQQITARRDQLATYRAVYAETYAVDLDPVKHEAADGPLRALLDRQAQTA